MAGQLSERLQTYEQMLRGAVSLLAASDNVNRGEWRSYVTGLEVAKHYPGVEVIGYADLVPTSRKDDYVADRRAEGFTDYRIRPAGDRPLYAAVLYGEPFDRDGEASFGFDLMSDPAAAAAMERARDQGGSAIARMAQPNAATPPPAPYFMHLPVYGGGHVPTSLEARRNNLVGFVFASMRMDRLLPAIFDLDSENMRVQLFDGLASDQAPIFDGPIPTGDWMPPYSLTLPVGHGGQQWALRFDATPAFLQTFHRKVPPLIAVSGITIGILLFLVAWSAASNQEQLRERDAQLGYLFEKNPAAMLVVDRTSLGFLEANEAATRLYGHTRSDFLKMRLPDLRADEETMADPGGLAREVEYWTGEWRHRVKDDRIADVALSSHRLRFRGRDAVLTLVQDITETKRARVALLESERYFHTMADSMPAFIWLDDPAGQVQFVNKPWLEYTGRKFDEQIGERWVEVVHPDDVERISNEMTAAYAARQPFVTQYRIRGSDGEYRWYADRGRPRIGDDWRLLGYIGVLLEITELREAQEQLQHVQKMEAVGRLTGGIAHDFNNLLSIILGNADLLVERLGAEERLRENAATIVSAAMRAAELTNRMLAFSRRQQLQPQPIDVNALIDGFRDMLERSIGEDIELAFSLAEDLWRATADPDQLESAILNLAINARDAMPDGGKLTIVTANVPQQRSDALLRPDGRTADAVMIAVRDTGSGMPPEVLEKVFEPFFTTKEVGKGTGLGLPIVYGFVKQSGGHVQIKSDLGRGTTVRLYLPRAEAESTAAARGTKANAGEALGGSETILVVEDDAMVRTNVERQLAELGYRVIIAENGPSGLARLNETADIDLLFTDVIMPGGMNGRQLAEAARKIRPGIAVLFTTGYANTAFAQDGGHDPNLQLLTKPYRRSELAQKIRRALDHGRSPAI